jgi:UDP-glucose 4-epimerase
VPTVLGFDPLFQFMHEQDAAAAIALALDKQLRGVFNVAGPPPVPLSVLIHQTQRQNVPIPEPLIRFALGRFGFPHMPKGAIDHLKYPIVVDATAFRTATGFEHEVSEDQALRDFCGL